MKTGSGEGIGCIGGFFLVLGPLFDSAVLKLNLDVLV